MTQNKRIDDQATIFHLLQSSAADSFLGDMCGIWYYERFHIFMNGTSSIQHSASNGQPLGHPASSRPNTHVMSKWIKIESKVDQQWINSVILIHSCA